MFPLRAQKSLKNLPKLLSYYGFQKQQSLSSYCLATLIKHCFLESPLEMLYVWIIVISFTELLGLHILIESKWSPNIL